MLAYRNRGISANEGRKEGTCSLSPTFKSHRLDSKVKLDEWVPWVCAPQKTRRPRKRPRCPQRKCRLLCGQAARLGRPRVREKQCLFCYFYKCWYSQKAHSVFMHIAFISQRGLTSSCWQEIPLCIVPFPPL